MTVAVAWIRKLQNIEELIIASDSRLCGGYRWDCCPKILTLPRNDVAIAFAGETGYAYPLMMQAYFASGETHQAKDRAIDLVKFNGFLFSQINSLNSEVFHKSMGQIMKNIMESDLIWSLLKHWFHYCENRNQKIR